MAAASLAIASPAWRAARACACVGALMDGSAAADDVLGVLASLGEPPGGWWHVLGSARPAGRIVLVLPRPGDPRGLALPRDIVAEAALGWPTREGAHWLIPTADAGWIAHDSRLPLPHPAHAKEALRGLREAVVEAAHAVDALAPDEREADPRARRAREALVDSWVLGPPPLPAARRELATLGLRMLDALTDARAIVDTSSLEVAARGAVESAFSTASGSG